MNSVSKIVVAGALSLLATAALAWPTEEWPRSTPEAHSLDRNELDDMARYAQASSTSALIVIRGGDIVLERYFVGGRETMYNTYSLSKSLMSLAAGLAIDDGDLALTDTVKSFYPALTGNWANITVQHLLQMRSGIDINNTDQYNAMQASNDWGAYVMGRPINKTPGTWWRYKADPQVLSNILTLATGKDVWSFLQERVFNTIGIRSQVSWDRDPTGHSDGNGGFETTAENLARIGYLMLHNGEWDGVQLLPVAWVDDVACEQTGWEFANPYLSTGQAWTANNEYGYYWWCRKWAETVPTTPQDAYYAFGGGGQFIIVIPSLDIVMVRTGTGPAAPYYPDGVFLQEMLRFIKRAAS